MKSVAFLLMALGFLVWFPSGCAECDVDHTEFWNCYYACGPSVPRNRECVEICVDDWYCSDWGAFCDFYEYPYCDPVIY